MSNTEEYMKIGDSNILHTYNRYPIVLEKGDGVYLTSKSKLYAGGKVVISGGKSNLYLSSAAVYLDKNNPLTAGSKIGINTISTTGKVTYTYFTGAEKYFVSDTADREIIVADNAVYAIKRYNAEAHKAHTCKDCGNTEWTPWTNPKVLPTEAGHYYLCGDVTVGQQKTIPANTDVTICLNGHEIISSAKRPYLVNGTGARLTLTDCTGKGKIYNSTQKDVYTTDGKGRIILVGGGAELNIFDIAVVSPSYKSDIEGGGAIAVNAGGSLRIKDAEIIGGPVTGSGGAIYASTNCSVKLENVKIKSGKADTSGDAIYLGSGSTLGLAGKIEISGGDNQVYLKGALIYFNDAISGNTISVKSSAADGKISDNYIDGVEKYIVSTDEELSVIESGGALYIAHKHLCDECDSKVEWTAWSSTTSLPTVTGHYYLTDNVTVNGQVTVQAGKDVTICLNGFDIKSTAKRAMGVNGENAKLTITNCKTTGKIYNGTKTDKYAATEQGRVLLCGGSATLNLYNLTVEAPEYKSTSNGGAIASNSKATVNITNCKIIGRDTAKDGGAIYIGGNGKASLKDVEIVSGKADGNGDAIFVGTGTTLNLAGKITISGGTDQIHLKATPVHFVSALSEGSSFSISTASADKKISDNYFEGMENVVSSGESGMKISVVDNTYLKLITAPVLNTVKPVVTLSTTSSEPKSAESLNIKVFSKKHNLLKEVGIA